MTHMNKIVKNERDDINLNKWERLLYPYSQLKEILNRKYLSVGDVADRLNKIAASHKKDYPLKKVTYTMLYRWYKAVIAFKKKNKIIISKIKTKDLMWQRFSLFDCICLNFLKTLKDRGIPLKDYIGHYHWLETQLQEVKNLIHFMQGRQLIILWDFKSDAEPFLAVMSENNDLILTGINKSNQPLIIIPLTPIIEDVIQLIYNPWARIDLQNKTIETDGIPEFFQDLPAKTKSVEKDFQNVGNNQDK